MFRDERTHEYVKLQMKVGVINTSYGNPVKLNWGLDWKMHSQNKTNLHLVFHILFSSRSLRELDSSGQSSRAGLWI